MQGIFLFFSLIISAYIFLIIFKIFAEWFGLTQANVFGKILYVATDWFLKIFRRIKFLRYGLLDFSPLLAILCLQIISLIFRYLALAPFFSLKVLLVAIVLASWNTFLSVFIFFGLVSLLRIILLFISRKQHSPFMELLDNILDPVFELLDRISFIAETAYLFHLFLICILALVMTLLGLLFIEPILYSLLF